MARTRPVPPSQLSFLDMTLSPRSGAGSLSWDGRLRALISAAIKTSRYSREEIAERMTDLAGEPISRAMLDSWTAASKHNHHFPLSLIPAFSAAAEDREILRDALALLGARIATREDLAFAEIGRLQVQVETASARKSALRTLMGPS
jgi:hypothetical protein